MTKKEAIKILWKKCDDAVETVENMGDYYAFCPPELATVQIRKHEFIVVIGGPKANEARKWLKGTLSENKKKLKENIKAVHDDKT